MARISTYALDDTLEQDDKIIGTDTSSANATMNFSLQQLGEFYTRTGLADASTVFTFDVAAQAYGTTIPTTLEDGTIYFNFNVAADLSEMIIPIETNSGVATLPFVNAISNEVVIINQAGAGRGLHYGFYDVGQTTANRDVEILGTVRGYRIPLTIHASGATTTGLPTGHAVVTPIGIVGTSQDLTTRLLTDLANVSVTDDQAATFRAAIGLANIGQQFADQQALEDFITNKADFRTDLEIDDQFADQTALETFITDDAAFRTAIGAGIPLLVDGTGSAGGINNVNELFFSGSNIEISSDQGGGATVTVNHVPIEKDGLGVVDANQVQINTINYTGVGVNVMNSAGVLTVNVPGVDSNAVALNTTHRETITGNPHDVQVGDISNLVINTNTRTITIGANTLTVPGTTDVDGNTVLSNHSVTELNDVTAAGSGIIISGDERIAIGTNTTNLTTHTANVANPHTVTATQVGLGNVDNTTDLLKPISTATQTALDLKVNRVVAGNPPTTALLALDNSGASFYSPIIPAVTVAAATGTGNAIGSFSIDPFTQVITPVLTNIQGGTATQTNPTVALNAPTFDPNFFSAENSAPFNLNIPINVGTGNEIGVLTVTMVFDSEDPVVTTPVVNETVTIAITPRSFDTLTITAVLGYTVGTAGTSQTATASLTLTRSKSAPSGLAFTANVDSALRPFFFRNAEIENDATGNVVLVTTGTLNGWTATPSIADTITVPVPAAGNVTGTQTYSFTAPAGSNDTTPDITLTLTKTRIDSLRISTGATAFGSDTLTQSNLDTLTNWNVTGNNTGALIRANTYQISTQVGRYTYFALPNTLGTPTFMEGPFVIAYVQQSTALTGYNIWRSQNAAVISQTFTYTITVI